MTERLGPLELVGDRWTIGDPYRKEGSCLVLTPDGMEHHKLTASEPLTTIPWSRVVDVPRLRANARAWTSTRTAGVLFFLAEGPFVTFGPDACLVNVYLRHPYEDVMVKYTHHERRYPWRDSHLLEVLFQKTIEVKGAHRLGDPEWLGEAVTRVAALRSPWSHQGRRVGEIIADLTA